MSSDQYMQDGIDMAIDSDEDLDEDEDEDHNDNSDSHMVLTDASAPSSGQDVGTEEDSALVRRRAIQAIVRDASLGEEEKRNRIQSLMSGNRTEVAPPQAPVLPEPAEPPSCVHYERNCNVVAPCCDRVFGCRVCHDELSPSHHSPLNRYDIREIVCKKCNTRQPTS